MGRLNERLAAAILAWAQRERASLMIDAVPPPASRERLLNDIMVVLDTETTKKDRRRG